MEGLPAEPEGPAGWREGPMVAWARTCLPVDAVLDFKSG